MVKSARVLIPKEKKRIRDGEEAMASLQVAIVIVVAAAATSI